MTVAFHFLELPSRYLLYNIARITQYIVMTRERKPPELTKLLDHARKGDVAIFEAGQDGPLINSLINTATLLCDRGVELHSLTTPTDLIASQPHPSHRPSSL